MISPVGMVFGSILAVVAIMRAGSSNVYIRISPLNEGIKVLGALAYSCYQMVS